MPYYIIFCKSAKERNTLKSLRRIAKKASIDIAFRLQEKEMINHTKTGRITKKYNLIPGYIFAYAEKEVDKASLAELTRANDFFFFLSYSDKSIQMRGEDKAYCALLFEFPSVIRKKNVFIRAGQVIIVTRGAFTSLKGRILNIDMKRERVEVEITLLGKPTKISLPVDHVEETEA